MAVTLLFCLLIKLIKHLSCFINNREPLSDHLFICERSPILLIEIDPIVCFERFVHLSLLSLKLKVSFFEVLLQFSIKFCLFIFGIRWELNLPDVKFVGLASIFKLLFICHLYNNCFYVGL